MTKAEQETVIRWDEEEKVAYLWTASARIAHKWFKAGYEMEGRDQRSGTTYSAKVPAKLISFRKDRPTKPRGLNLPRKAPQISATGSHRTSPGIP